MIQFLKDNSFNIFKMLLNQLGLAMLAVVMSMATYESSMLSLVTSIICTVLYVYILYTMTYEIGQKDKPAIDGGRAVLKPFKGFWISFVANIPNIICGVMAVLFSFFIVYQQPVTVYNSEGKEIRVYTKDSDGNLSKEPIKLYSDNGAVAKTYETDSTRYSEIMGKTEKIFVYDALGNEVELFTETGEQLSTTRKGVENWATNLYSVPLVIAIFFQQIFFGIRSELFANSEFVYLFTPLVPILFCSIAYYFGVKGKRIFFFLPERKQKPPKYR